jgi:2-keto-4-pentenoate hydratase/2-oxohepta-3-ene-1,7-dioic acid hydratase in catechol pathway
MRLVRFQVDDKTFAGRIDGKKILPLGEGTSARQYSLDEVRLLAPCSPCKIVAVGLNYRDHAEEMKFELPDEPLLFMKPSTSIIGPGDPIMLPPQSRRVDYEAELAVVIAKTARNVPYENARDFILGYTCLNDVTARDLQQKDGQWTRAKGFDTFCPIGPWIETDLDASDLPISLLLNGEVKQESRTSNLIFNSFRLVEFISHIMTLMPGDVIATGTTSGIGPMKQGDTVEVRVEGIGSLINPVQG